MLTWFDIEPLVDKLEELDKATLESFARVMPPPSQNPAFHHKFDHAHKRILRRLQQIKEEDDRIALKKIQQEKPEPAPDHWYKKPIGVVGIAIVSGLLLYLATLLVKKHFGLP